jgi:hypothetical protein
LVGGWPIEPIFATACLLTFVPAIYALHRLGLYLERRGLIYYWRNKPTGGSAYNPLQEIYQPQIRHVIQVREQRLGDEQDDEGGPPLTSGTRQPSSTHPPN